MNRKILSLIWIAAAFAGQAVSQIPNWIQYTNGTYVTALAEEATVIWAGTSGGLAKIDKATVETIQIFNAANSPLPGNHITAVAVDGLGYKWVGTKGKGAFRFAESSAQIDSYRSPTLPSDIVNAIAIRGGDVWVGTQAGLAHWNGSVWTTYSVATQSLQSDTVTALAFDRSGWLWIGTNRGVVRYDGIRFADMNIGLTDLQITSVAIDTSGRTWVGTVAGGAAQYQGTAWSQYTSPNSLPSNFVTVVAADSAGQVWIGMLFSGMVRYSNFAWSAAIDTTNSDIPDNNITALFPASDGNLWVGTRTGGLARYVPGLNWTRAVTSNSGLMDDRVDDVAVASNGKVWVSSLTGYAAAYDGSVWTSFLARDMGIPDGGFTSLAVDAAGNAWVGTQGNGAYYYDGSNWIQYSTAGMAGFPNDDVTDVAVAPNGDVWVATSGGVGRLSGSVWTTFSTATAQPVPDDIVSAVEIGGDGTVWISDNKSSGPVRYTGTGWLVQDGSGISMIAGLNTVRAVSSTGSPWVSMVDVGAAQYSGAQWIRVDGTNSNIPSTTVRDIAQDQGLSPWFAMDTGVARFDRPNFLFTDVFRETDSGLPDGSVNAIAFGPDNKLYAATDSGLAVYSGLPMPGHPAIQLRISETSFGSVVVGQTRSLTGVVKNTGSADLILSSIQLPFGFSLASTPVFPDTIAPNDSIQGLVQFTPTEAVDYFGPMIVFSNAATSPDSINLSGTGVSGGAANSLLVVRNPMFNYGTVPIYSTGTLSTYLINAGAAELRIDSLKFVPSDAGAYSFGPAQPVLPILRPAGDSILVSIRFSPTDVRFYGGAVKIVSNSPTSPDSIYIGGAGSSTQLTFTGDAIHVHTGLYGFITIPYVLEDSRISSVLAGLGTQSAKSWRLFYWKNGTYLEYPFSTADSLNFRPGIAYWLVARDTLQLTLLNPNPTPEIEYVGQFARIANFKITLRPGWNMIGNPFVYAVSWNRVLNTGLVQAPVVYNVRWQEYGLDPYTYNQTLLEPWRGYFVYNRSTSPIVIEVPPGVAVPKPQAPRSYGSDEFVLRMRANGLSSRWRTGQASIGMLRSAADDTDPEDYYEAPMIGDHLRLSVTDGKNRFAGYFKAVSPRGAFWDLLLSTTGLKETVEVSVGLSTPLPQGFDVWLLDQDRGCVIPVRNGKALLDVEETGKNRRFRAIVGMEEYADQIRGSIPLVPYRLALLPNFPNPFNPETRIEYHLAEKGSVFLEIYDVTGRRVRSLVRGELDTGVHEQVWDGTDDAGRPVTSGVYLCRLAAGKFAISRKMILIR
jgi:ligand-binding sensor domain-containing protein